MNSPYNYLKFLLIVSTCFVVSNANAQINKGGKPKSFTVSGINNKLKLPFVTMPSFDVASMLNNDSLNRDKLTPFRFAKGFDVNYSINNSGLWETLENGDKLWRLGIVSKGAYAINILFSIFEIPEGANVFIYNTKKTDILGAFTSQNNLNSKILSTAPVNSDSIVVEYFVPSEVKNLGSLTIGNIGHSYVRLIPDCQNPPYGSCKGRSSSCEVDIYCPPGANWQNEKQAVCRLIFYDGASWLAGTGALINNTANDGNPYLLTANHCICNNTIAQSAIALFNYDSPVCNGADGRLDQSISGATLLANNPYSDFALLQLSSTPPQSYNPYYLGWDRTGNNPSVPATIIHHPMGDVKKISVTDNGSLVNIIHQGGSNSDICAPSMNRDVWNVKNYSTGVTEGGSSGAPLLDANHHVIGQLYSGNSTCGSPRDDYYGRFSSSWNYGGTNSTQLSYWLDPIGTNPLTLNGTYPPQISGPSLVCTSGTFTINNVPSGYTVSWSGAGLTKFSSSGNTAVFNANSLFQGIGQVIASYTNKYGNVISFQYDVWVGAPVISNVSGPGYNQVGAYAGYSATVSDLRENVTSYNWTLIPGIFNNYFNPGYNCFITWNRAGQYVLQVNAQNSCPGTSATYYYPISVANRSYLSISPNPASDNVQASIIKPQNTLSASDITSITPKLVTISSQDLVTTYTIKIYNPFGTLIYSTRKSGDTFTIPVNNIKNGTYIIEANDGKQSFSQQLIIEH